MKTHPTASALGAIFLTALLLSPASAPAMTEIQAIRITEINGAPTNYLIWNDDGDPLDTVILLPQDQIKLAVTVATGQLGDPGLQTWGRTGVRIASTDGPDVNTFCFDNPDHPAGQTGVTETFTVDMPGGACGELQLSVDCFGIGVPDCTLTPPFVMAIVNPGILVIGPQQPEGECFPAIERCLVDNNNTTATITAEDLLVGGIGGIDPNCGTGRVVAVQREDTYGSGLFSRGRSAIFDCTDISLLLPPVIGRTLGAHLVRVVMGDSETPENFGYCYTYVTIRDCTAPAVLACPPDQDLAVDHQCIATIPDYRTALVGTPPVPFDSGENISDNCTPLALLQTKIGSAPQRPGIYQVPAPGTIQLFEDSSHKHFCPNQSSQVVTLYVVDQSGNTSSCSFTVHFVDNTPPVVTCPTHIDLPQFPPNFCGRQLTLTPPGVLDNCCIGSVFPTIAGSMQTTSNEPNVTWTFTFPIGRSFVIWHVFDCCGNETTCVQEVRIRDIEDPVITCPPNYPADPLDLIHNDPGECGAFVEVAPPEVSDNCEIQLVYNDFNWTDNASGFYPVGTTTVGWTVVDEDGRTATCSHTVTVVDDEPPFLGLCQCVQHFGSISPLNFGIVEINEPPCDLIPPSTVVSQLQDKWISDFGWWLLFGAHDNCSSTIQIIEFVRFTGGDFYPLVDSNGRYIPRTDPFPLGLSFMMFVAEDPAGNYSQVCLTEILVVHGQCQNPGMPRGACCGFDGSCTELTSADCTLVGGTYQGNGTFCTPSPCPTTPAPQPAVGACCLPSGQCETLTLAACIAIGGTYKGDGVACDGSVCLTPLVGTGSTANSANAVPPVEPPKPAPSFGFCGWGAAGAVSIIAVGIVGLRITARRRRF